MFPAICMGCLSPPLNFVHPYLLLLIAVFHVEPPRDNEGLERVRLDPSLKTFDQKSEKVAAVLNELRKKDVFVSLKGWRDEVGFSTLIIICLHI